MTYFINTTMMDTINTNYKPKFVANKGETWYVKLPGEGKSLTQVVVTDLTAHTVEVQTLGEQRFRYVVEDVYFVEKVYQ